MKLVIDISEEKYEWVKKNNPNIDTNSIVGAIANGTPYEERPKGKWIEHEDEKWGGVWHTCSKCYQDALYEQDVYNIWRQKLSDFCPNCGADMRGEEE